MNRLIKPYWRYNSKRRLMDIHGEQLVCFQKNREKFKDAYESIRSYTSQKMTHETWEGFNQQMEKELLPQPPISFFYCPTILKTMTGDAINPPFELFLDRIMINAPGLDIRDLLTEDLVGIPMVLNECTLNRNTSFGRIVHLYQASICLKVTNTFKHVSSITEWGGGFGGLARIFNKLEFLLKTTFTYNIIDLPIICCLQWLYLSSILGEDKTNLVIDKKQRCEVGKINIIPNGLVEKLGPALDCDIFVSAWALSESSAYAQKYVSDNNFFNAKHGLIIHQKSSERHPYAEYVKTLLTTKGISFSEQTVPYWNSETALFW